MTNSIGLEAASWKQDMKRWLAGRSLWLISDSESTLTRFHQANKKRKMHLGHLSAGLKSLMSGFQCSVQESNRSNHEKVCQTLMSTISMILMTIFLSPKKDFSAFMQCLANSIANQFSLCTWSIILVTRMAFKWFWMSLRKLKWMNNSIYKSWVELLHKFHSLQISITRHSWMSLQQEFATLLRLVLSELRIRVYEMLERSKLTQF